MSRSLQAHFDYAIIGGGCMGVSAALALQKQSPNLTTILFEGTESNTASKGTCKIIRTPYMDKEYVLLAEEAKKRWESAFPYYNFYRRTGWVQEVHRGTYVPFHSGERSVKAEDLSHMVHSRDLPHLNVEKELWFNEDIGVADSALALEAVAEEAASKGVARWKKKISKLIIKSGICCGVECVDGTRITATTTIVATGPWTPALLSSSDIHLPDHIRNGFFSVTAIGVATLPLTEDEYTKFSTMPILVANEGISTSPT
ncbi:MAG: hypothetical protein Q9165_008054 [Trypethelium subeluteriae]